MISLGLKMKFIVGFTNNFIVLILSCYECGCFEIYSRFYHFIVLIFQIINCGCVCAYGVYSKDDDFLVLLLIPILICYLHVEQLRCA